ncbi:hypothetical protein Tco_0723933 [Tanacetum coccineum]
MLAKRLSKPEGLNSVHDTFHLLNLKKCLADVNLHVPLDEIKVDKTLRFVEEPIEIMDQEIKKLKHRKIALVKIMWKSKCGPEFIWNMKNLMRLSIHSFSWIEKLSLAIKSRDEIPQGGDTIHPEI